MKQQYLLLLLCLSFPGIVLAQSKIVVKPKIYTPEELVFQSGERLTLVANYRWGLISADVGEASMSIEAESFRDTHYFYVRAFATTYKFWDKFFQVRDVYEGHFDSRTLQPLYFHRNINEEGYKLLNTLWFNNENYTIKSSIKRNSSPRKDTVLQGNLSTFDLISLFFNSRNLDFSSLEPGKIYPFSFVIDDELYNLSYRFICREEKSISGLGRFRCLKFAARLVAGEVFTGENELNIWISDDANRIPLLIQSPVKVGTISARLSKYANLKYPLTSKIQ